MFGCFVTQHLRAKGSGGHRSPRTPTPGPGRLSRPSVAARSLWIDLAACRPPNPEGPREQLPNEAPQRHTFIMTAAWAALSTGRKLSSQEHIKCWCKLKAKSFYNQIVIIPKGIIHWKHFYQHLLPCYIIMGYFIIKNTSY